jgi:hypothetical protein
LFIPALGDLWEAKLSSFGVPARGSWATGIVSFSLDLVVLRLVSRRFLVLDRKVGFDPLKAYTYLDFSTFQHDSFALLHIPTSWACL